MDHPNISEKNKKQKTKRKERKPKKEKFVMSISHDWPLQRSSALIRHHYYLRGGGGKKKTEGGRAKWPDSGKKRGGVLWTPKMS